MSALKQRLNFEAIGTVWSIGSTRAISQQEQDSIQSTISNFDSIFSRFRPDSYVSHVSKKPGTYDLPEHCYEMLELYKKLYIVTDGLVTPLIGKIMEETGYNSSYSFMAQSNIGKTPDWSEVISYDHEQLTLHQSALLDFGAVGKGYLVDLVAAILRPHHSNFVINAGGDIFYHSQKNEVITVGLENPFDTTQAIGVASISNQALCGSSPSRRSWGNFHHIMNPKTNKPAQDIMATWVTAQTTAEADGISTALFFTPPDKLRAELTFEYAILRADNSLQYSQKFLGEFFSEIH